MPMPKAPMRAVKCAACKKDVWRTIQSIGRSGSGLFFCNRACKHKGQTRELALIGHSKKQRTLEKKRKLRKCLGWCGKSFKTTVSHRFCEACTKRKEFAATAVDEFDQDTPWGESAGVDFGSEIVLDAQSL